MHFKQFLSILTCFLCTIFVQNLSAQDEAPSKVKVKNADTAIFENEEDQEATQYLKGNVKMAHDSVFMYADSATIQDIIMNAVGEVVIIQEDSLNVFADSMYYNSETNQSKLFRNVVLDNGDQQLFSDVLYYNTKSKIATYQDTAILKNKGTKLTSKSGVYNTKTKQAFFKDQVVVIDSNFEIHTDSLQYNTQLEKVVFMGPTWITRQEQEIYCESGFYQLDDGKGYFTKNAYINDKGNISRGEEISLSEIDSLLILDGNASYTGDNEEAEADIIIMDEKTDVLTLKGNAVYRKDSTVISGPLIVYETELGNVKVEGKSSVSKEGTILDAESINFEDKSKEGFAEGNVIWLDTIKEIKLESDFLEYAEERSYFKAYGEEINPIFLNFKDGDSMYLSADTLINFEELVDQDTINEFFAYKDVKIWKTDFRAVADSMHYSSRDSIFKLYGEPIMWADSSQYTGDTILIYMKDDKIDKLEAFENGFIINQINEQYFDQIKGKHITSYLKDNDIEKMDVIGSAQAIYFLKDDVEAFIGANHTLCSSIRFFFDKGELDDIKFFEKPESTLTPIPQLSRSNMELPDFDWQIDLKPLTPEGIRVKTTRKVSSNKSTDKDEEENSELIEGDDLNKTDKFEEAVKEALEKPKKSPLKKK